MEKDNEKYWLNEHGLRYWTNKNDKNLTAMRSYHWKDHIAFIDESDGERRYVGQTTFSEFMNVEENWHPMSKKQYEKIINDLHEKHGKFYEKLKKKNAVR
jgi:hypothetical protein